MENIFVHTNLMDWLVVSILAAAVILIIGLTARKGFRAALRARRRFEQAATAPLASPALDGADTEDVEELTLKDETVLSRLVNLNDLYDPEDLVQIARDVLAKDRTFDEVESAAFLERALEWEDDAYSTEEGEIMYRVAAPGTDLEMYVGALVGGKAAS